MKVPLRRKKGILPIVSFFIIPFVGLFMYKVFFLKYPIQSKPAKNMWTFELKITFQGVGKAGTARHYLPSDDTGQMVLEEDFVSRKLDFFIGKENGNTFVQWRGKQLKGDTQVFYRATVQTQ